MLWNVRAGAVHSHRSWKHAMRAVHSLRVCASALALVMAATDGAEIHHTCGSRVVTQIVTLSKNILETILQISVECFLVGTLTESVTNSSGPWVNLNFFFFTFDCKNALPLTHFPHLFGSFMKVCSSIIHLHGSGLMQASTGWMSRMEWSQSKQKTQRESKRDGMKWVWCSICGY